MNLLDKIGREFSGYNLLESGKRLFDRKPLQCSLYLTDKCNLDCSYCTEYDNSKPHPQLEVLELRMRLRVIVFGAVGAIEIALVGEVEAALQRLAIEQAFAGFEQVIAGKFAADFIEQVHGVPKWNSTLRGLSPDVSSNLDPGTSRPGRANHAGPRAWALHRKRDLSARGGFHRRDL